MKDISSSPSIAAAAVQVRAAAHGRRCGALPIMGDVRGGVMFEAALALPVFILFVLGTIELGIGVRSYFSASRALNMTAHELAAISSIDDWRKFQPLTNEETCMEIAGNTYIDELQKAGGSIEAASSDAGLGGGQQFVLAGFPFQIPGGYPAPRTYELRAQYRYSCLLCGIIGRDIVFRLTALAVLESARGCESSSPPEQVAAYFPSLPQGQRVEYVPRAKVN